jgi:hypothetical protein
LDLVEQSLLVTLVSVGEEVFTIFLKLLSLPGRLILKDPTGLKESSVDEVVESGEVLSELWVASGVGVDLVKSIGHTVHGFTVGESLEKGSELTGGAGNVGVFGKSTSGLLTLVGDVFGGTLVVLEGVEQPGHSLVVILVVLALHNDLKEGLAKICKGIQDTHLLQSVDELLPPLLGERILDDLLGSVNSSASTFSVLLWNLLLELVGLVSSLVLGITRVVVGTLLLSSVLLVLSSAEHLVLLLREGSVGVSVTGNILGVRLDLLFKTTLGRGLGLSLVFSLVSLLLGLLLLLLSLVVGLAGRSGVTGRVGDAADMSYIL